jgi:hypothetical protein
MKNWRKYIRHPWVLAVFLLLCWYAAGISMVKNTFCFSSPCDPWVEKAGFHFEADDNLLVAPGLIIFRTMGFDQDHIRVEPPLITLSPFQSVTVLSDDFGLLRGLVVSHILLKILHVPLWVFVFWVLEELWTIKTKWSIALRAFLVILFLWSVFMSWSSYFWATETGYSDVTRKIFLYPEHAGWVAG